MASRFCGGRYNSSEKHSATVTPGGIGRNAYVKICKTDAYYRVRANKFSELATEAKNLRALLGAGATRPALSTLARYSNGGLSRSAAPASGVVSGAAGK